MQRLLIIGAGDHGRGTLEIVRACNTVVPTFDVVGFVDDRFSGTREFVGGVPVLGNLESLSAAGGNGCKYVIAVANTLVKQRIAGRLHRVSADYGSVVHPSAVISPSVVVRGGAIVGAGVVVAYDTVIEEHVTLNLNSTTGHDCSIGRFVTVAPGANIAGRVALGEGCDIGLNAAVSKGVRVGAWSTVGPGTVIVKDVVEQTRMFGNPARVVL